MAQLEDFMAKTAAYIAAVQPENDRLHNEVSKLKTDLNKAAEAKSSFIKRATQAAGVLANRGILDKNDVNSFIDKVAEDTNVVWDLIEKMASSIGADSLGDRSTDNLNTSETGDPWVDTFFRRSSSDTIY